MIEIKLVVDTVRFDFVNRDVTVLGKVVVGKREIELSKSIKCLQTIWDTMEEVGRSAIANAVNEAPEKRRL